MAEKLFLARPLLKSLGAEDAHGRRSTWTRIGDVSQRQVAPAADEEVMKMGTTLHPRDRDVPAAARAADYRAGALAGLAAGVAMSFVMMALTTLMMNMGPWAAPKMAWSLVAGPEVIRPGFEMGPVMGGMPGESISPGSDGAPGTLRRRARHVARDSRSSGRAGGSAVKPRETVVIRSRPTAPLTNLLPGR